MAHIQIPAHIITELLTAIDEAVEVMGKSCEDCDCDGEFSFSRGRLFTIRNVIEETAKEANQ